jgi:predicted transcriptional regulator
MRLPSEIRERRHAPGGHVSQTELGIALGRSQTWIGMVERGVVAVDASMIERALLEVDRIIARKKAIAKAKLEAVERVTRDFENRKIPVDAGR